MYVFVARSRSRRVFKGDISTDPLVDVIGSRRRVPCRCDESDETVLEAEWKYVHAVRAAAAAGEVAGGGVEAVAPGRKVGESYEPSS